MKTPVFSLNFGDPNFRLGNFRAESKKEATTRAQPCSAQKNDRFQTQMGNLWGPNPGFWSLKTFSETFSKGVKAS